MDNVQELKNALIQHNPILFLGAGFSLGAENAYGKLPSGEELSQKIFEAFIEGNVDADDEEEIKKYDLQDTCQVVDEHLQKKDELRAFLVDRFAKCVPQDFHLLLPCYPWKKIYTVNIDDVVESVYAKSKKDIVVQNQEKQKATDSKLEYIKLHGCVNAPDEPFVFSTTEYTNLISSKMNFKLNNLVSDIQTEYFIFVGASLDERDIEYYITQYENAGYFRKGKLFFIDPKPSMKLKGRVKKLEGSIIEWTAETFLKFVEALKYNPAELQLLKHRLNYSGLYLYEDIINSLPKNNPYESKLYEGYNSKWEDVINGWIFEAPVMEKLKREIGEIIKQKKETFCLALYGRRFTGKDCILKQLGHYLNGLAYEVIEYKGKKLNIALLQEYIQKSEHGSFALLIENASFYYKTIEKLLTKNWGNNRLLIVTSSRKYYHTKKRYYLEGTPFAEYEVDDKIDRRYAEIIYDKLLAKGYTGNLPSAKESAIARIIKQGTLVNLFTLLTYGDGFKKRITNVVPEILRSSNQIRSIYIELSVFDKADLAYYPYELLTERYSIDFNIYKKDRYDTLPKEQRYLVDYVRIDNMGVSLKNIWISDMVWKNIAHKDKKEAITNILKSIAGYVSEREDDYWRIIFESLLKEDQLENQFKFKTKEILNLYYGIKNEFSGISYYWLQLGIAEQKQKEFSKALNHLLMARKIRPNAYQIQHAIARNYLKHANSLADSDQAAAIFQEGEKYMLELIHSHEHYKDKAKNFSIHCYVYEKISFIEKHQWNVTDKELLDMKHLIDTIINDDDKYIKDLAGNYVRLLQKLNKIHLIHMQLGDKYYAAYAKGEMTNGMEMPDDKLVDSY